MIRQVRFFTLHNQQFPARETQPMRNRCVELFKIRLQVEFYNGRAQYRINQITALSEKEPFIFCLTD